MKQCTKCLEIKTYSDFHKKKQTADGYAYQCKQCVREYDMKEHDAKRVFPIKVQGTKIHCRNCEKYLDESMFGKAKTYCVECTKFIGHRHNLTKKNISVDKYVDLLKEQKGVCKICGISDSKRLSVDHDHSCCDGAFSCGKCIRGLLCSRCNRTLGMVNDNVDLLNKMIKYLEHF